MDSKLLRLLDANANRAREGLRVVEDYVRFMLDNGGMAADLKDIRHELADATKHLLADAIYHRDTPGDVGTGNKTEQEFARADLSEVVTAAGKRLGEALRAIEESLKVLSPADAPKVELLRYRFYSLEQQIAYSFRADPRMADVSLYVLITESLCKKDWLTTAEEAIVAGADCIQLREKELEGGELLRRARLLIEVCRGYDVPCIINDRVDVALMSEADGVHVGQGDLPAREARKLLGRQKIIGVSTHNLDQARQAVADGADYIGVGPFFRSQTKPRDFTAGPEYAKQAAEQIPIPSVAIAGITPENVAEVLETGVRAVAVSSAVISQPDVGAAVERFRAAMGITRSSRSRRPTADPSLVGQTFLSVETEAAISPPVGQAFLPVVNTAPTRESPPSKLLFAPNSPTLLITRRHLPHWKMEGSTYFITFRVREGELTESERLTVLDHICAQHRKYYFLVGAVIMPDHVHLILRPTPGVDLSRITKGTKGDTGRLVNQGRGLAGEFWQNECFDRIIRDQDELEEKLRYIFGNPVKRGLVNDGWDYPALYLNEKVLNGEEW